MGKYNLTYRGCNSNYKAQGPTLLQSSIFWAIKHFDPHAFLPWKIFSTYISVEKKHLDENQNKNKQIHHETNSIKNARNNKIPAVSLADSANS